MNALMTIQVQVVSASALAKLRAVEAQAHRTAGGVGAVGRQAQWGLPYLSKWGNQVQWAGRQLMYNFTLPIALATAAGTKFALDNEKAMVRVEKVYGDASKRFDRLAKTEIPALTEAFEALSSRFGVQQSQVIQIAGDWAAAGASGIALAKSVKLTLETMVLGELEAVDATKQLIAIQAQYGFGVTDLTKTIDILNMVENQTGASMRDLMDGMSRAAGVARVAGVDVEHLSAMMAALVPASGSAATAGNALKTIISRILSPTKDAVDLLREMGVAVDDASWQSQNATKRIEALAEEFDNLSSAQKTHMATVLGSRWQLNRLVILMQAVRNENSYYNKALKSTTDRQAIFNQRQEELQKVLESNPQRIQQAWVILQNAMASVIVPLLPFITYMISEVARLAEAFANLDGEWQKLILVGLALLAVIGPIARYVGAMANLFGLLAGATHFFAAKLVWLGAIFLLPFKLMFGWVGKLAAAFTFLKGAVLIGLGKQVVGTSAKMLGLGKVFAAVFALAGKAGILMLAPFKAALVPIVAAWAAMMVKLRNILVTTMTLLRILWAAGLLGLSTITGALMTGMLGIWAGAQRLLLRSWQLFWASSQFIAVTARAQIIIIWATMMTSMRTLAAGLGRGIMMVWTALHTALVTVAAAAAAGVKVIWFGMFAAIRAVPAAMLRILAAMFVLMRGIVVGGILGILRFIPMAFAAMFSGVGLAITAGVAAVVGLLYAFRDQIADVWDSVHRVFADTTFFQAVVGFFQDMGQRIVDAFWMLPEGVRNAMIAVMTVVRDAALQIYDWMSYLNPFARHSPSLVDNVTKGMDAIEQQYGRSDKITGQFKAAQKNLEQAIAAQERVVHRWEHALGEANRALDIQQGKLDKLQSKLDAVQAVYDRHSDAVARFAEAPIKGMGEMSDKIFQNELAQKKLRLEMLKFEKANGPIEDVRSRLDALYGDIELLTGKATDLRNAGAGSDIIGPIEAQIAAMEREARALQTTINKNPVDKFQKQLEELELQGEILQLQNDIKYDPMIRTIENLANAQKELSYDEIVNGIRRHKRAMDELEPSLRRANAAVDAQQKVVDRATAARDAVQRAYDREQDQLSHLKDRYDHLTDSMNKNSDAAKAAAKAAAGYTPVAVETFRAGAGGNWADPGGMAKIGREGGLGDQSKLIEQFTQDTLNDMNSIFGGFDMFGPLKKWWARAWDWIKSRVGPYVTGVADAIRGSLANIGNPFERLSGTGFSRGLSNVRDVVVDVVRTIIKWGKSLWRLFGPDVMRVRDALVKFGEDVWNKVGPLVESFGELWEPLTKAFKNLWRIAKPIVALFGILLVGAFKILTSVASRVLGPFLDLVVDIITSVIRIFRGLVKFIIGVFTLDFKMALSGIWDIVAGVFGGIWAIIKGAGKIIWGVVSGVVMGIIDWFKWLYDELVGHSIVPDMIDAIIDVFKLLVDLAKWVWEKVLRPIYDAFVKIWKKYLWPALKAWWGGIKDAWGILKKVAGWLWDNVLKPVWEKVKDLWPIVKALLKAWWEGIKTVWNILKTVAVWLWDNVLKPVWTKVKSLWDNYVKPGLKSWWEGIKTVWSALKSAGMWVWDNVLSPVIEKFRNAFSTIRDWMQDKLGWIVDPFKAVVRGIVGAINWIIKGINLLDKLPGVEISISTLSLPAGFEQGGIPSRRVGSGFMTRGARAIVGEGKANYPEFVIPTDPTYRKRARTLLGMAAGKLGLGDQPLASNISQVMRNNPGGPVPHYSIGGWIGENAGEAIGGMLDLGRGILKFGANEVQQSMEPYIKKAREIADNLNWYTGRDVAHGGIDVAASWVGLAQRSYQNEYNDIKSNFGAGAVAGVVNGGGKTSWKGGTFTNRFVANMEKAQRIADAQVSVMQGGFRPATSYSGTSHQGDAVDFQVNNALIRAFRSVGIAAGDRTGLGNWGPHTHAIPGPQAGSAAGSAVWQWQDYMARGGPKQSLRSPWGLKHGAIVRRTPLGTLARIGEGSHDEAVTPLPRGWRQTMLGSNTGGGDTIINIYGNLEFPNIEDGSSASEFVKNLKILAKD